MFPPALDPNEFLLSEPPGLVTAHSTPARLRPSCGMELCEMVQVFLSGSSADAAGGKVKEVLRALLHQFEKTQLIELILTAVVDGQDALETVRGLVASSTTFRRLLVRNIPFSATSDAVKLLLSRFGPVEEGAVVFDRATGRSKGFAFATFSDVSAACAAVAASLRDEISMDNRTVFLKFAADRNEPGFFSGAGVGEFVQSPSSRGISAQQQQQQQQQHVMGGGVKLFVYNLSPATTSESLRTAFAPFGEISECAVVCDAQGRSKRFAFVTFVREEDAWKCLQEPNRTIDGRMTFTHLASEGRSAASSGRSTPSLRSSSIRTPRGERTAGLFEPPQHVFTPQGGTESQAPSSSSLLNESLLSQWIAELNFAEEVTPLSQHPSSPF